MTAGFPSTKSLKNMIYCSQVLGYTVTETTQQGPVVEMKGKSVDLGLYFYFRAQACGGISLVYSLL